MIRRISANNDYRDIIRSCPSGVIDDIYEVEYYVDGYSNVYSAAFSKKGSLLEVIIPSSALQTLPSGLLMRRAKYSNADSSFPDGNYNLEFVEDMNVWLESGSGEPGPGPVPGEYLTADDLKTINNESLVGEGNIQIDPGVPAQTFTDHVIGNIQAFSALDNRVTALEQNPGVSQDHFAAHVAQNAAQFSNVDYALGQMGNQVVDAYTVANDALNLAGQAQHTAESAASQAAQAHQRALQAIQKNETQDAALESHNIRITELENSVDATQQDLATVDSMIRAVRDQVDSIDTIVSDLSDSVSDLDTRVTDLEQGGVGGGSWGSITGTITDQQDLVDYVDQAIEDAISGSDIPLPENVVEYDVDHPLIEEFGLNVDVLKRNEFDHGTDVITKGLVLGYEEIKDNGDITDINTIEIRDGLLMAVSYTLDGNDYYESRDPYTTESWVQNQGYLTDVPSTYATKTYVDQAIADAVFGSEIPVPTVFWGDIQGTVTDQTDLVNYIGNQGFLTSSDLSGYATETWVGQQGYITSSALSGYATESWVQQQGYLESSDLSGYATESWSTNQFLEESKVWSGTEAQWNQLSAAQKASYTIALITQ